MFLPELWNTLGLLGRLHIRSANKSWARPHARYFGMRLFLAWNMDYCISYVKVFYNDNHYHPDSKYISLECVVRLVSPRPNSQLRGGRSARSSKASYILKRMDLDLKVPSRNRLRNPVGFRGVISVPLSLMPPPSLIPAGSPWI